LLINKEKAAKAPSINRNERSDKKQQRRGKSSQLFLPTNLTTIYEDVEY
jgi:hypothetical protein